MNIAGGLSKITAIDKMSDFITIEGAREHNLKNVNAKIPRNSFTVITGLSGSGKSSLAFDTLYAEGQRRYVESLSAYARQFLGQLQKPDVEFIDGLSPAIAIEQRTTSNNPRSIVATSTEIHDYLRLLYGAIAIPHCPKCGRPVRSQSAEEIVNIIMTFPERTKLTILAPVVRGHKGTQADALEKLRQAGFARIRLDGTLYEIDEVPEIDKKKNHNLDAVVDRVVVSPTARTRLTDSVELALKHGEGILYAIVVKPDSDEEEQVFSEKNACPHCSISFEELKPRNFSFNNPHGACPTCSGLGQQLVFEESLVVPDTSKSLEDGAIQPWTHGGFYVRKYYKHFLRGLAEAYGTSADIPYCELPEDFRHILMHGTGGKPIAVKLRSKRHTVTVDKPFDGALAALHRLYLETEFEDTRQRLERYMVMRQCPDCKGARLKPESRAATVAEMTINDVMAWSVRAAALFFDELGGKLTAQELGIVGEVLKEIRKRIRFLIDVGLDYITLDRVSSTLSGGEMQRIRLATQIGSGLVGVLYVLDEPTIGLHSRDNEKLIAMLRQLQQRGNTVVVVEHDEEVIRAADHIIDLGPGAGREGGNIVYEGDIKGLLASKSSLTADYLTGRTKIETTGYHKPGRERIVIKGAAENNLKNIDVSIPTGCFVCVTGVSGSGKSSLVDDILRKYLKKTFYRAKEEPGKFKSISGIEYIDKVIEIDQSPIGTTPRSNPATYTDAFTPIRTLFSQTPAAKMRGYGPGRFSFNVKGGRCEACKGDGVIKTEMHFLPDVYVTCDQCGGRRFNQETLQVLYGGKNIADVLEMTIDEACEHFSSIRSISTKLQTLKDVGLGYVQLGQSSTTLSGGEAQRVKLATELARQSTGRTLYLLDEPTTGLHFADVHKLLELLLRLRDAGNTVLVIEHNLDVIRCADYIIDLGPEGGENGGRVVATGSPAEVAACPQSYTGQFLKKFL